MYFIIILSPPSLRLLIYDALGRKIIKPINIMSHYTDKPTLPLMQPAMTPLRLRGSLLPHYSACHIKIKCIYMPDKDPNVKALNIKLRSS